MTLEGFMRLTDEELSWLGGRVTHLIFQEGCIEQCLGCAKDPLVSSNSTSFKDVLTISRSIEQVAREKGIHLVKGDSYFGFDGTNPLLYRSSDSSIWNVAEDIFDRTGLHMVFSIPGWSPTNQFEQATMANIVRDNIEGKQVIRVIYYGIKPMGALIRTEYEQFVNNLFSSLFATSDDAIRANYTESQVAQLISFKASFSETQKKYLDSLDMPKWGWFIKRSLPEFLSQSRYVHNVVGNMGALDGSEVAYSLQYVGCNPDNPHYSPGFFERLPQQHRKYEFLLTQEFMEQLADYCIANAFVGSPRSQWIDRESVIANSRAYQGYGRAIADFGFPNMVPSRLRQAIKDGEDPTKPVDEPFLDKYLVKLQWDGTLRIFVGTNDLDDLYLPPSFFSGRAQYFADKDSTRSREYTMLAGLQGKNILH